ncbi:MAG: transposase [Planctomycetes bacterium]|nr:transposase [Planctomycetota bacterium]
MPGGRPSKFTPEVQERILKALAVGMPMELTAQSAGVSYATFRRWLKRGESQRKGELREFAVKVQEARAQALLRWLAIVDKAAFGGNWKAAVWKAEHAYPEFFRRPQIDPSAPGQIILGQPGAFEEMLRQLRAKRQEHAVDAEPSEEAGDPAPQD